MRPASAARAEPLDERLLVVDVAARALRDARVRDLPDALRPGDLLVVNDAATLPASLAGRVAGARIELRLAAHVGGATWCAVLFGDGDWRTRTEDRAPPPRLDVGARLSFGDLSADVLDVAALSARLLTVRFDREGATLWRALYHAGRHVQYAHVDAPLELWDVQTPYGARPWAVESPSAGRPLHSRVLAALRARGVELATLTHAAGLSSTGDPAIDAALPPPVRFDLPERTVAAIVDAKARGGRVVAAGTTVVRALEGCVARSGRLVAGEGTTDVVIDAGVRLRVVDAILTGLHEPTASHFRLLGAFAPTDLLAAYAHAERAGYVNHELGDSSLILRAG